MARKNHLIALMETPLPSIAMQKRKCYRPTIEEVHRIYDLINKYVYNNKLVRPPIELGICRKYWGMCYGLVDESVPGSFCRIRLMNKWFCVQWLVNILAHEMAHQYQWDVLGPKRELNGQESIMSHGPSFFMWRDAYKKYGLNLKTVHRIKKWFLHQEIHKC